VGAKKGKPRGQCGSKHGHMAATRATCVISSSAPLFHSLLLLVAVSLAARQLLDARLPLLILPAALLAVLLRLRVGASK
jgi:hypothetical protein